MSFTTLTLVKKHLLNSTFGPLHFENTPVKLSGTSDSELPHHNLVDGSETVKRDESTVPDRSGPHTLSNYDWANLDDANLASGSAVVTPSEACETIFAPEKDYQLDFDLGRIRRVPGTSISHLAQVYVYYTPERVFAQGSDYEIDYALGTLHRLGGGNIPDGGMVLVDYDLTSGSVEDDLIAQAIIEAEDLIVRNLAPGYTPESTDQGLKTGATYLTLSILARALCTEFLGRRNSSDGATRAKEWITLSEKYEAKAMQILGPFLLPISLRSALRYTEV